MKMADDRLRNGFLVGRIAAPIAESQPLRAKSLLGGTMLQLQSKQRRHDTCVLVAR
ncbi:hypothetical protein RB13116 [Rhodopirellula baltica SH 1]|uniref:Uncharacterized protein n=1 Tax=Rhodopirellula baltica (strain DSM 10527 / NCIMB 13988 / SH1) TaxID=243090 RepID=Q7UHL8_RHOBA|nr:hypothetical protein RB13116 [Rhodopirellula baltica SH 1]